jgi:hypothetical protein
LNNIANQQEIDEELENITTAIIHSPKETIQFQEKSPKHEW